MSRIPLFPSSSLQFVMDEKRLKYDAYGSAGRKLERLDKLFSEAGVPFEIQGDQWTVSRLANETSEAIARALHALSEECKKQASEEFTSEDVDHLLHLADLFVRCQRIEYAHHNAESSYDYQLALILITDRNDICRALTTHLLNQKGKRKKKRKTPGEAPVKDS